MMEKNTMSTIPKIKNVSIKIPNQSHPSILFIFFFCCLKKKKLIIKKKMLWILFYLKVTSFNIIHDRITQIGALAICNKKTISTFSEYVNPLKPLHPKAAQVTNLSDTFLQ